MASSRQEKAKLTPRDPHTHPHTRARTHAHQGGSAGSGAAVPHCPTARYAGNSRDSPPRLEGIVITKEVPSPTMESAPTALTDSRPRLQVFYAGACGCMSCVRG